MMRIGHGVDVHRLVEGRKFGAGLREIVAGRLPLPVKFGSRERWHRQSIDEHLDRIVNGPGYDWRAESPLYANDPRYQRK